MKQGDFISMLIICHNQHCFQLKQDEILGYDDTHNGYFITHDIYEEWALDKIVSRSFLNSSNVKRIFDDLGNSLPIRRALECGYPTSYLKILRE